MTNGRIYLFNQLNTSLQVHSKVNEDPINAFATVLFLFKDEHLVVEKLLESFVREVNTQLFKSVILKGKGGGGGVNCLEVKRVLL